MPDTATTTEPREVTITVSGIPAELLREIDALAKSEERSRSGFLRRELTEVVRQRRSRVKQKAA